MGIDPWGRKGARQQGRQSGVCKDQIHSLGSSLLPEVHGSVLYALQRLLFLPTCVLSEGRGTFTGLCGDHSSD